MQIDFGKANVAIKSLNTFANAYGLKPNTGGLIDNIDEEVRSIGLLLRDPQTKKGLLICEFPLGQDITSQMIFPMISEVSVEAVPMCTRQAGSPSPVKDIWRKLRDRITGEDQYCVLEEGEFRIRVHPSFRKRSNVLKYFPKQGYGFVRGGHGEIYFRKDWTEIEEIRIGTEVAFIPCITRQGLQARAVIAVSS